MRDHLSFAGRPDCKNRFSEKRESLYMSAGFSSVRMREKTERDCDNKEADPACDAGDGGKQPGKKRKAPGVYEKV